MPPESASWQRIFELFHDGNTLTTIMSGWRLDAEQIAQIVISGHRAGERVDPAWLVPASVRQRVMETIESRPDLSPMEISSQFQGVVPPAIVRVLREIGAGQTRLETRLFNEETFFTTLHDDLAGAQREILVVAAAIKGAHWRRHMESFQRLIRNDGQVAFFSGEISEMIVEGMRDAGIILIEKNSNANLVLVDGEILWEGSMNFMLAPKGDEHIRRTKSRLQCDEVKDLNDLFL